MDERQSQARCAQILSRLHVTDGVKAKPGSQGPARNANPFLDVIVYCHLHLSCRDLYRTKDESVDLSMEFILSVNDLKFHFFPMLKLKGAMTSSCDC